MDVISTEFRNQPTSMFLTDQQENTYFHEKDINQHILNYNYV